MRRAELEAMTKARVLALARDLEVPGRSSLSKDGLIDAVMKAQARRRKSPFASRSRSRTTGAQKTPAASATKKGRAAKPARKAAAKKTASKKAAVGTAKKPVTKKAAGAKKKTSVTTKSAPKKTVAGASRKAAGKKTTTRETATGPSAGAGARTTMNKKQIGKKAAAQKATTAQAATAKAGSKPAVTKKVPTKPAVPKKPGTKPAATQGASARKTPTGEKVTGTRGGRGEIPAARREALREHPVKRAVERAAPPPPEQTPPAGTVTPAYPPQVTRGAQPHIPSAYGEDHVALLVRDPYWLHAYWEVTESTVERLRKQLGEAWHGHRRVLRVYTFDPGTSFDRAHEGNGEDSYDIDLPPGSANWYLNVGRPDHTYRVAVGVIDRSGTFHAIARSNPVATPRDMASNVTDEEWTQTPQTFRELYEMASPQAVTKSHSSAELGMLLRERLRSDWSSGQLASMGSGALAQGPADERGFWFVLDAELIVYGATEADAKVTVQGRPIKLRPDGTFSLRFQLPDGTQVIDATAESADGIFRKTITPTVRRDTTATEMIENHTPQRARS